MTGSGQEGDGASPTHKLNISHSVTAKAILAGEIRLESPFFCSFFWTMTEPSTNAQTYKLPESARNNARQVLEWRKEHGGEVKGMTEVGWRRARQLADNAEVDLSTVKKMSGFIRHEGYYRKARAKQKQEGKPPWTYPAIVAWKGWGGDSGIAWARKISEANP